jgi:iron(III)-enterobactin esterase
MAPLNAAQFLRRRVHLSLLGTVVVFAATFGCGGEFGGGSDAGARGDASTPTPPAPRGDAGPTPPAADAGPTEPTDSGSETPDDAGSKPDSGMPVDPVVDAGVDQNPASASDGDFEVGPSYKKAPEMSEIAGVPKGKIYSFTMASKDSKIFPGLTGAYTRSVKVYVPVQYVEGTEAPFIVAQDGDWSVGKVTTLLNNLIHQKKLPPMVGIFVHNGGGDGPGTERGLEYDRVTADYADFIETEVLPAALSNPQVKADHPKLALSKNPWNRATMGCSSGAAAALTMGWFRPNLFRRILTLSGTFVDQHQDKNRPNSPEFKFSAWSYHDGVISNTPQKPLRIFLHVGEKDLNLDPKIGDGRHNWVTANRETAKDLKAKDYRYRYVFAKGSGHCDGTAQDEFLPEAMLWLWRGYQP